MSTSSRTVATSLLGTTLLVTLLLSQARAAEVAPGRVDAAQVPIGTTRPEAPAASLAMSAAAQETTRIESLKPVTLVLGADPAGAARALPIVVGEVRAKNGLKDWMLVGLGVFLIAAICRRRLDNPY